jgi:cytochrome c oxidase assembly factor 2
MPPHLHPRSRFTSSLFATTLFASFFVVALPHVLPCPAPRGAYADDGTPRRRRRRKCLEEETGVIGESARPLKQLKEEISHDDSGGQDFGDSRRECPIPKPGGLLGEILGFSSSSSGEKGSKPP